ncbi:MAG: transposase [Salinispira sp.]
METRKVRKFYDEDFKEQAVELAKEIGTKQATEKLGIASYHTLAKWVRNDRKMNNGPEFRELQEALAENKRLRKELSAEKKSVAILNDAMVFFCRKENLK